MGSVIGQRVKIRVKNYLAELTGTFALVFCGTGAIIINEITNGAVTHIGIAITFGLIVLCMIYTVGDISGAHLNPAVTAGFLVSGRFEKREALPYIISQVTGAFLATGALKIMFPENQNLGSTIPAGSYLQSFVLEIILTFFLMLVILNVSQGAKEKGLFAGIAVGAVILLEAMFAGPVSGASMNPARSLAPAVISGNLASVWIYLSAPFIGSIIGVFCWKVIKPKK